MNRMDKIRDEKQKRDGKQKMDDSLCANGMDSCGILDEFLRNGWLRWMNSLGIRMNRMNPFGIWMDSFGIWMIAFGKDEFLTELG